MERAKVNDFPTYYVKLLEEKVDVLEHVKRSMGSDWISQLGCLCETYNPDEVGVLLERATNDLERNGIPLDSLLVLKSFGLVELHPSDVCNLRCRGCAFRHDIEDSVEAPRGFFPFEGLKLLLSILEPRAITLSGGGEPLLYSSGGNDLGDLIMQLSRISSLPLELGLITNLTFLPPGDEWWSHLTWIRGSLDAGSPEVYERIKGRDFFDAFLRNLKFILTKSEIGRVGICFGFAEDNVESVVPLFERLEKMFAPHLRSRLSVQFRPWRDRETLDMSCSVLSKSAVDSFHDQLKKYFVTSRDGERMRSFVEGNTNCDLILRRGCVQPSPFSQCYSSLVKTMVRSDGSLYPCCVRRQRPFYLGNILRESPIIISLRILYVFGHVIPKICVPHCSMCNRAEQNRIFQNCLSERESAKSCVDAFVGGSFSF